MIKSNDGIPSTLIMRMKVHIFLSDTLNKYIPRKKWHGCLMKKAAATLRCFEKQVLAKRIKAAIKRCSLKQVF